MGSITFPDGAAVPAGDDSPAVTAARSTFSAAMSCAQSS